MKATLKPMQDDSGDAYLEIPGNILRESGLREGDLVELFPGERKVDGEPIELLLMIRRLRH